MGILRAVIRYDVPNPAPFRCRILCVSDADLNCTLTSEDPHFYMEMAGGAPLEKFRHLANITSNCIEVNQTLVNPVLKCYEDSRWKGQGYLCARFREKQPEPSLFLDAAQTVYDFLTGDTIIYFYAALLLLVLIYCCLDIYLSLKRNTRPIYKRFGPFSRRRGQ